MDQEDAGGCEDKDADEDQEEQEQEEEDIWDPLNDGEENIGWHGQDFKITGWRGQEFRHGWHGHGLPKFWQRASGSKKVSCMCFASAATSRMHARAHTQTTITRKNQKGQIWDFPSRVWTKAK